MSRKYISPDQLKNIQALLGRDLNRHCQCQLLLEVARPADAKLLLELIREDIAWSDREDDNNRVHAAIGFTFAGLQKLQLPEALLDGLAQLSPALAAGAIQRGQQLGLSGHSNADYWQPPFQGNKTHAVIILLADKRSDIDAHIQRLSTSPGADAWRGWDNPIYGEHLGNDRQDRREHFGFRDGISQPNIAGLPNTHHNSGKPTPAGDIFFGYQDLYGSNRAAHLEGAGSFYQNGTLAALSKMEQDPEKFHWETNWAAFELQTQHPEISGAFLRAKLCGRWPNGMRVTAGQFREPALDEESLNDFDYRDDSRGEGCPFSSHIRRLNPRDDNMVPARSRPLLRRSIPYGTRLEKEKGLLGIFACVDLEEQFEFLMSSWVNKPPLGPDTRSTGKDPLIGLDRRKQETVLMPMAGEEDIVLQGLSSYIQVKGILYLFFPGRQGLEQLLG